MACARTVAIDRMLKCRWHRSFCMDDDCTHPCHSFSVPCDSDSSLCEICEECLDFEKSPDTCDFA